MKRPSRKSRGEKHALIGVLLLTLFFAFFARPVHGQPTHYSLSATAGQVIATNGSPFSGKTPTVGVDAALYWQQTDSSFSSRFWRQPFFGLRTNYAHLFHSVAGDRMELAGLLQGPVAGHLDWTYSVGLSFYTRPYSLYPNPENTYIGSVVNCLIDFGFLYNIPLSAGNTLFLAAKLVHSSNGYLYKPNHGLNYLQMELGLRRGPHQSLLRGLPQAPPSSVHGAPFVLVAPGLVQSRYDDSEVISYHPVYTVQLGYIWHAHPCFSYGASLDLSYNFTHRQVGPADEWPVYPAAFVFGDCQWGPVVLRLGLAHYLAYYPLNWEQYYERVGLYYRFGRQMAGVGMKVHYDHIDYIEWSWAIEL